MRLLFQATRAVTVELIGVLAFVWLLFSATTWTMSATGTAPESPWREWGPALRQHVASVVSPPTAEQQQYTQDTLDRYGERYKKGTALHIRQLASEVLRERATPSESSRTELLGAL